MAATVTVNHVAARSAGAADLADPDVANAPNTGRRRRPRVFGGARRQHGASVPFDRDELERSGWRTTLEYRENHVRRRDGRLDQLEVVWHAEAERTCPDGSVLVVTATAHSAATAWSRLRSEADLARCRPMAAARTRDDGRQDRMEDARRASRGSPPAGIRRHRAP